MTGGTLEHELHALAAFLRAEREHILEDWQDEARRLPPARALAHPQLLDHLPSLLDGVTESIDDLARGREPELPNAEAQQHASARLGEGFDLREVVQEYALLRECVLIRWMSRHPTGHGAIALHRAIDRAIGASVESFSASRERTQRALDRIASAALAAPDLDSVLQRLLQAFRETTPSVDTCAILLREGDRLCARATVGLEEEVAHGFSLPIGAGFSGEIAQHGEPRELHDPGDHRDVSSEVLRHRGVRVLYGVPLKDGSELIGVAHMGSRVAPEFSDEDKRLFRVMTARASSGIQLHRLREKAETRARALSRMERLLSVHPDFFYLLDRDHRFLYVSPSLLQLWGRSAEEALGKTFAELGYPASLVELHARQLDQVLSTGDLVRGENAYGRALGEERHYEYIFAPVFGVGGRVEAIAGVTRDVTMRKLHELELDDATQVRERLIGVLGHDLRSPLSTIKLSAQLLLRDTGLLPLQRRSLDRIVGNADRMSRMVRDIVDFARSRHGASLPITPEPAHLDRICENVVDEFRVTHPDQTITLLASGPCEGRWDQDRLTQVVTNLLSNAFAHGSADQPVTVTVRGGEGSCTLEVHNWGNPIPPEAAQRIFEPFRTASKAASGSIGLGLYIVRELVLAHGGSIELSSTQREGTRFRVVLPKLPPTAASEMPTR